MKRILLLYTGGTVGCEGQPLAPMSAARFEQSLGEAGLIPAAHVACELRALSKPLDSANMQPANWLDIAAALLDAWASFDAFVVLHGTDTLAYTAAALSFLLAGSDKPVVLTGAQYPLSATQSDAPRNIADAIVAARAPGLCEVVVCFAGQILRGNRSVKRSATDLDAFASPNWPILGTMAEGVVTLNTAALLSAPTVPFKLSQASLTDIRTALTDRAVWAIHLHPGFPVALLHAALALPSAPRGWVLACYGAGNAPSSQEFLDALQAARERGVLVVAVTQTGHGAVKMQTYAAGVGLIRVGVVSARDMSLPAAVVKLQLLLARGLSSDELLARMLTPMAGEMAETDA
ncbi:MAG: L-asparaginase [Rhodocyclales bacterium]|nr:L-asparaginase [Rhodocyclales bacterium]